MLAKGNRSKQVTDACKKHGGFYLGSIGGPAARLAQDCIKKVEVLDYPELGMEAVWMSAEDKASADVSERVHARMQSADAVLCLITYRRGWEPEAAQGRSLAGGRVMQRPFVSILSSV